MTVDASISSSSSFLPLKGNDDDENGHVYLDSVNENITDTGDDTPLARLISNRNSSIMDEPYLSNDVHEMNSTATTTFHHPSTSMTQRDKIGQYQDVAINHRSNDIERWKCRRSNFILISGTCFVLFGSFLWSSYTSNTWYNTVLNLQHITSMPSSLYSYPYITGIGIVVQSNDLLSFLQQLWSNPYQLDLHRHSIKIIVLMIITTTVVVPCVAMVWLPIRMTSILSTKTPIKVPNDNHRTVLNSLSSILEITLRFSFVIVYVFVGMIVANHFVTFHLSTDDNNSTIVSFDTIIMNGLTSYTIGVSFAIVCVLMIRSFYNITNYRDDNSNNPPSQQHDSISNDPAVESTASHTGYADPPIMQILEEQAESTFDATTPILHRPQISLRNRNDTSQVAKNVVLPFWKLVFAFQCGLLSVIMMIPSFYLPVLQLQYDKNGWISDLMPTNVHSISLYQIPSIFFSHVAPNQMPFRMFDPNMRLFDPNQTPVRLSDPNQSPERMLGILVLCFLVVTTVLCPLYAIVMAIMTWMTAPSSSSSRCDVQRTHRGRTFGRTRDQYRDSLYMIHPAVGGIVLAVSLLLCANIIYYWNLLAYATGSFYIFQGHNALRVDSSLQIGIWCYLVHSLLLEVFILVTLKWS